MTIRKLHHAAYRCRDSEQTRKFYEDFLGLPLVGAVEIGTSKTGRGVKVLHTFYRMADGSQLAFFDAPEMAFEFKTQHDFDLHIALEVELADLEPMLAKGRALGIEGRGISNHGSIHSVYFRDPSGYVVELCARIRQPIYDAPPREILDRWNVSRRLEAV
jgi:catechol 2,3-dioxygenase-like lactoylglutathione lyase family enzyme